MTMSLQEISKLFNTKTDRYLDCWEVTNALEAILKRPQETEFKIAVYNFLLQTYLKLLAFDSVDESDCKWARESFIKARDFLKTLSADDKNKHSQAIAKLRENRDALEEKLDAVELRRARAQDKLQLDDIRRLIEEHSTIGDILDSHRTAAGSSISSPSGNNLFSGTGRTLLESSPPTATTPNSRSPEDERRIMREAQLKRFDSAGASSPASVAPAAAVVKPAVVMTASTPSANSISPQTSASPTLPTVTPNVSNMSPEETVFRTLLTANDLTALLALPYEQYSQDLRAILMQAVVTHNNPTITEGFLNSKQHNLRHQLIFAFVMAPRGPKPERRFPAEQLFVLLPQLKLLADENNPQSILHCFAVYRDHAKFTETLTALLIHFQGNREVIAAVFRTLPLEAMERPLTFTASLEDKTVYNALVAEYNVVVTGSVEDNTKSERLISYFAGNPVAFVRLSETVHEQVIAMAFKKSTQDYLMLVRHLLDNQLPLPEKVKQRLPGVLTRDNLDTTLVLSIFRKLPPELQQEALYWIITSEKQELAIALVQSLLDNKVALGEWKIRGKQTIVEIAFNNQASALLKSLLENANFSLTEKKKALYLAMKSGNEELCLALLEVLFAQGLSLESLEIAEGHTVLGLAFIYRRSHVIDFLLLQKELAILPQVAASEPTTSVNLWMQIYQRGKKVEEISKERLRIEFLYFCLRRFAEENPATCDNTLFFIRELAKLSSALNLFSPQSAEYFTNHPTLKYDYAVFLYTVSTMVYSPTVMNNMNTVGMEDYLNIRTQAWSHFAAMVAGIFSARVFALIEHQYNFMNGLLTSNNSSVPRDLLKRLNGKAHARLARHFKKLVEEGENENEKKPGDLLLDMFREMEASFANIRMPSNGKPKSMEEILAQLRQHRDALTGWQREDINRKIAILNARLEGTPWEHLRVEDDTKKAPETEQDSEVLVKVKQNLAELRAARDSATDPEQKAMLQWMVNDVESDLAVIERRRKAQMASRTAETSSKPSESSKTTPQPPASKEKKVDKSDPQKLLRARFAEMFATLRAHQEKEGVWYDNEDIDLLCQLLIKRYHKHGQAIESLAVVPIESVEAALAEELCLNANKPRILLLPFVKDRHFQGIIIEFTSDNKVRFYFTHPVLASSDQVVSYVEKTQRDEAFKNTYREAFEQFSKIFHNVYSMAEDLCGQKLTLDLVDPDRSCFKQGDHSSCGPIVIESFAMILQTILDPKFQYQWQANRNLRAEQLAWVKEAAEEDPNLSAACQAFEQRQKGEISSAAAERAAFMKMQENTVAAQAQTVEKASILAAQFTSLQDVLNDFLMVNVDITITRDLAKILKDLRTACQKIFHTLSNQQDSNLKHFVRFMAEHIWRGIDCEAVTLQSFADCSLKVDPDVLLKAIENAQKSIAEQRAEEEAKPREDTLFQAVRCIQNIMISHATEGNSLQQQPAQQAASIDIPAASKQGQEKLFNNRNIVGQYNRLIKNAIGEKEAWLQYIGVIQATLSQSPSQLNEKLASKHLLLAYAQLIEHIWESAEYPQHCAAVVELIQKMKSPGFVMPADVVLKQGIEKVKEGLLGAQNLRAEKGLSGIEVPPDCLKQKPLLSATPGPSSVMVASVQNLSIASNNSGRSFADIVRGAVNKP